MDAGQVNWQPNPSSEDEADYLEIPSFLESLANSASQLKELAQITTDHHIRALISFGYIHEPKRGESLEEEIALPLGQDKQKLPNNKSLPNIKSLRSISALVDFLPYLNELNGHLEKCFMTLEITFRRFNYHLNKSHLLANKQQPSSGKTMNEFRAPVESRFDPVFISIMDLLFAFISLDETIRSHTNIRQSLAVLRQVCQQKMSELDEDLSEDKLKQLVQLIRTIETNISNETIFRQCLNHLQHLDLILNKGNSTSNFEGRNVAHYLDEFIMFYVENLCHNQNSSNLPPGNLKSNHADLALYLLLQSNLVPTLFMTSLERKILGISSLFILNVCIFKRSINKKLARAFNQMLCRLNRINLINLAESNIYMSLADFLAKHLPKAILDGKTLNHLKGDDDHLMALDLLRFSNEATLEVMSWTINYKAACRISDVAKPKDDNLNPFLASIKEGQVLREKGIRLAEDINASIRSTIAVHLKQGKAIARNNLVLLLRSVALLKSIQVALEQNHSSIMSQQVSRERLLRCNWRKLMARARKGAINSRYSDRKLDLATCLTLFGLTSNLIDRLATDTGRSLLFMAISMLCSSCFHLQELNELNVLLSHLRADIYEPLGAGQLSCAYLYWNVPTFSAYYNQMFEQDPGNIAEIRYFHRALDDIRLLFSFDSLKLSPHLHWLAEKRDSYLQRLADELMDQFKSNTLEKICQELEIELRLQTHRDLYLDGHNPFRRHMYNFKRIFANPTDRLEFNLFGRSVSLRQYVEHYLSETYYNLTSIAPHDWFSYDCMINLARQKYGLQVINSQMPTQTIDCGVDLMEITRNLALFVSRYSYDMSNQLFVEKCSNRLSVSSANSTVGGQTTNTLQSNTLASNQSLNIIQIRNASMFIHNHGFGLLNSSINCTYQVMKRLISLISRQISDDRLRALLAKQHLQLSSCLVGSGMSFERALKLARKFKINNQQEPGEPALAPATGASNSISVSGKDIAPPGADLDQIRQSLTQLGNSLAFMRLLKSGALNCASKSVDYLPDLDDTSMLRLSSVVEREFGHQVHSKIHYDSLLEAAHNFDACLEDFAENFSSKTDYFSIVLTLFTEALGNKTQPEANKSSEGEKNTSADDGSLGQQHASVSDGGEENIAKTKGDFQFKFFYLLIPSLTINFIDYIINAKERVVSRSSANRVGALICDDGFSMGLAFLLIVLGQTGDFAKLEWFKEVQTKLDTDQAEVQRKIGSSRYEESLKQTSSMTLRRLNRLKQEYDALNYNIKSALLLFRSSSSGIAPLAAH